MTSIRRRLTVRVIVGVLSIATAACAGVVAYLWSEMREQFDLALLAKARAFGSLIQVDADGRYQLELHERSMPEFARANRPEYFQVWHPDGSVLERSKSLAGGNLPAEPLAAGTRKRFVDFIGPDGRDLRAIVTRIVPAPDLDDGFAPAPAAADKAAPRPTVMVAIERAELDSTLAHVLWALVGAALAMSVGVAAVVASVVRAGLAPLRAMGEAAASIDSQTLDYRFAAAGLPEELRPISLRFNDLLERVQEVVARERRFTADVAHELRTPVAELRLLAEVGLKWPTLEADVARQSLQDTLDIAHRMESVVTSLLLLVRCQSAGLQLTTEAVDLKAALAEAWRGHLAEARDRGLEVEQDLPEGTTVMADRSMLVSMLANLCSNAAAHAPVQTAVMCAARRAGDSVHLRIENANPGLVAADLPCLWEPFWRKQASRTDSQHCGLGLSLVRAYARAMAVGLYLELVGSDSVRMTVLLPCDVRNTTTTRAGHDAGGQGDGRVRPPVGRVSC